MTTRNDLARPESKLVLELERARRTDEGRVRNANDLVKELFPWSEQRCEDKVFAHLPREVRGPILAGWGIRGMKAALRDDDDKVRSVVHDAFVAGDVDDRAFEDALGPDLLVGWLPLARLWAFWRGGKVQLAHARKALLTAKELGLYDATWLLARLEGKGGKLKGIDVLTDLLGKEQLSAWLRRVHESGDGSPAGLLNALGWERAYEILPFATQLALLDALAADKGLVEPPPPPAADTDPTAHAQGADAGAQGAESVPPPTRSGDASANAATAEAAKAEGEGGERSTFVPAAGADGAAAAAAAGAAAADLDGLPSFSDWNDEEAKPGEAPLDGDDEVTSVGTMAARAVRWEHENGEGPKRGQRPSVPDAPEARRGSMPPPLPGAGSPPSAPMSVQLDELIAVEDDEVAADPFPAPSAQKG